MWSSGSPPATYFAQRIAVGGGDPSPNTFIATLMTIVATNPPTSPSTSVCISVTILVSIRNHAGISIR